MEGEKRRKTGTLQEVEKKFEYWRTHRQRRGPIPPDLLAEARSLLTTHPMGSLTRALRINYNTLRKTKPDDTSGGVSRSARGPQERPALFMEIPRGPVPLEPRGWPEKMEAIEFETPQGYKARFYTSQNSAKRIEELLTTLFRIGR